MHRAKSIINVNQLKALIADLKENRPDICIRFRLLGDLWTRHFLCILALTEKGLMLINPHDDNKIIYLSDLSQIMQFELDAPFDGFQPHFHYEVNPLYLVEEDIAQKP
jgi:hypothetical protein